MPKENAVKSMWEPGTDEKAKELAGGRGNLGNSGEPATGMTELEDDSLDNVAGGNENLPHLHDALEKAKIKKHDGFILSEIK